MARLAAIDIGTNSVLLTIAGGDPLAPKLELARITRLGQGVDRSGRLAQDAIDRTLECLSEYGEAAREHQVTRLAAVCTSAARDADNGGDFLDAAEQRLGVRPRIISGEDEARLTFQGASSGLEAARELLVMDVGGGSTEVISGRRGQPPDHWASLQLGSVRLTERHVDTDPPSAESIERIRSDVRRALESAARPAPGATFIGVAGTVTTLATVSDELEVYDSARVHGRVLSRAQVRRVAERLASLPAAERRQLPGLEPARADIIAAGAWLVVEAMTWADAQDLIVSDRGVRWGLLHAMRDSTPPDATPPAAG